MIIEKVKDQFFKFTTKGRDYVGLNNSQFNIPLMVLKNVQKEVKFVCHVGNHYILDVINGNSFVQEKMLEFSEEGKFLYLTVVDNKQTQAPELLCSVCTEEEVNAFMKRSMSEYWTDAFIVGGGFKHIAILSIFWDAPRIQHY